MNEEKLSTLLESQRRYFAEGKTLSLQSRREALLRLRETLKRHEKDVFAALKADLGKSTTESYMCEVGMVYSELDHMLHHLREYMGDRRAGTPLAQFPARSYVKPSPRGTVLIMSPWNYPVLLTLGPLVDAIAAGNTAVVKPSAYAPASCRVLETVIAGAFSPSRVFLVSGGREENQQLLHQKFDHIFFTGSQRVGKEVLRCAAEHLTPVTLELGGKSPCIVDATADIPLTARRIVFGKFLNCGQTCVAPDYICCHESVLPRLLEALKKEIRRQFGERPLDNPNYGKIISRKHFDRLSSLLASGTAVWGGETRAESLRIEPTVMYPCSWEDGVMEEEIFGPLLPVIPFRELDGVVEEIRRRPHPLAMYIFSRDRSTIQRLTTVCAFGGGCVNDTIIHLATTEMGFGGVGESGMGAYHGKAGFETFSHSKSIVEKKLWLDLPMRYQPYTKVSQKLIRIFLR